MTSGLTTLVAVSLPITIGEGLVIVVSVLLLACLAMIAYVLIRYLPIISNLFMNATVKTRLESDPLFEGETVRFKTADGVELTGTLTPAAPDSPDGLTRPVIVFCHEFSANRHSAGRYAHFLQEAGFRIFTFDFRGHGDSPTPEGYVSRLWVTEAERLDLRAALNYLHGREDVNDDAMGLFGISRGGVVALCGAVEDSSVKVVVTDGAYSAHRTMCKYMRKWVPRFARVRWVYRNYPDWFYRALGWLAIKFSELRMHTRVASLEKALGKLRVAALLIYGERDDYLDVTQAKHLAGLNPEFVQLWVIPGVGHNAAVVKVADEYHRRLTDFFTTHLNASPRNHRECKAETLLNSK